MTRPKNGRVLRPTWIDTRTDPSGGIAIRTSMVLIGPSIGPRLKGQSETNGSLLRYRFQRPSLLDLNDPIPLTFEITGVEPARVTSIECPGTRIERTKAPEGTVRFHIHCPARSSLPIQIDHVATDTGDSVASADFPAISGVLKCDGGVLILRLENAGPIPIQIERVAYRIPLRFGPGVVFRAGRELTAGQSYLDQLNLGEDRQDRRYQAGDYFFAAQVDFVLERRSGRVYFTTHEAGSLKDSSYPQEGFSVLGPVPKSEIDLETLTTKAIAKKRWKAADGQALEFEPADPTIARPLNVELIPVRGRWDNRGLKPCLYLLRSHVQSPDEREVRLLCNRGTVPATWLNGQRVGDTCELKAGSNDLLIAYEPPVGQSFSPEHAGPMLRIVDARTGQRVEDIHYQHQP